MRLFGGGKAVTGTAEAQIEQHCHPGTAVSGKVDTGDTQINDAVAHIEGDIPGTQKDKIDMIFVIMHHQFPPGTAAPVTGTLQKRNCTLRKCPLVGHCQFQISTEAIHKYL